MVLIHATILSIRFFSKENKVVKVSANKRMKIRKVLMQPKKKIKKKIKKDLSKIPMPVPTLNPIEFEEVFEEEEDEIFELDFDIGTEIVFTEYDEGSSEDEISAIRSAYIDLIYFEVNKYKKYPKMAKRLNQQGTSEILFTIWQDGTIHDIKISKSSRFIAIDKAAKQAVESIVKLDPIPDELSKDSWEVILPIKYELY
jgi:protein TonB